MRSSINLLVLLLAFLPSCLAQGSEVLAAIQHLPPCAVTCLAAAIPTSPCSASNQTCICTNAPLQRRVEECVVKSCSVKQSLVTKNVTVSLCHVPPRDRSVVFKNLNIILGTIAAVLVLVRVLYKAFFTLGELGWDDYFIIIVLFTGIPSTIITDRGTIVNGLGKDIWTLQYQQITDFVRYFYVMAVLYFAQVMLLKQSLLFFYLRIFPARPVKRIIWATIAFNSLFGVVFIFVAIFQCRPISHFWKRWDGEDPGKCININALAWSNAAISIALDIWMLAIPLTQVFYLNMAWRKKVGVALMFCVGTFVTVVSILRLQSLVMFAKSTNVTWDFFNVSIWSTVEINVGIICACLPAVRVILVRISPRVFGTTRLSTNNQYSRYGNRSATLSKNGAGSNVRASHHIAREKSVIKYTKSFEVRHADNDEVGLVQMESMNAKGVKVKTSVDSLDTL